MDFYFALLDHMFNYKNGSYEKKIINKINIYLRLINIFSIKFFKLINKKKFFPLNSNKFSNL